MSPKASIRFQSDRSYPDPGHGLKGIKFIFAGNSTFTVTSNATSNNTNNAIVSRNSAGGFSAGIVTSTGLNVSGVSTFQGNVYLGDNDSLYFGDSNDLYIVHNGSISAIADVGAGDLYIANDNALLITNAAYTENKAVFNSNGSVEFFASLP